MRPLRMTGGSHLCPAVTVAKAVKQKIVMTYLTADGRNSTTGDP